MNQKTNIRTVTFKELWNIFIRRVWILLVVSSLTTGIFYFLNHINYVPQYASTATLYILRQGEEQSAVDASSDFSLALKVVNDCTYLLKSHTVLDKAIENLNLEMEYDDLYDRVSTSNPDDTRILEVTVIADSPEMAKRIVDDICDIGAEQIEKAMGFPQVNLFEHGTLDPVPCNGTRKITYVILTIAVAVLLYMAFLIIYLVDDRIRTDEDIEKILGMSILADIPNADSSRRGKGDYGYRYGYGYGYGNRKTKAKGKK